MSREEIILNSRLKEFTDVVTPIQGLNILTIHCENKKLLEKIYNSFRPNQLVDLNPYEPEQDHLISDGKYTSINQDNLSILQENSFDIVLAFNGFSKIIGVADILLKVSKCLKEKGVLFVKEYDANCINIPYISLVQIFSSINNFVEKENKQVKLDSNIYRMLYTGNFVSLLSLRNTLESLGLQHNFTNTFNNKQKNYTSFFTRLPHKKHYNTTSPIELITSASYSFFPLHFENCLYSFSNNNLFKWLNEQSRDILDELIKIIEDSLEKLSISEDKFKLLIEYGLDSVVLGNLIHCKLL